MYTHIAKDWRKFQLPNQAKNAIDSTIKANEQVKTKIKRQRKDLIWETVDRSLYEMKSNSISIGKLPRKK